MMQVFVLCLFLMPLLIGSTILTPSHDMGTDWEAFKVRYNKTYRGPIEEKWRRRIWVANKRKISLHNARDKSFQASINEFGDMLHREFLEKHKMTARAGKLHGRRRTSVHDQIWDEHSILRTNTSGGLRLPKSFDWRTVGAVTPPKNQMTCGSCWAFASAAALESLHFIHTGRLVALSAQNLVDCVYAGSVADTCEEGGTVYDAFNYVMEKEGIDTDASYPYENKENKCDFREETSVSSLKSMGIVPEGDEKALKMAVAIVGPVAVGIDSTHDMFMFYRGGVYSEEGCVPANINHAVLVVGYGRHRGQDYWLLKNSWGVHWGIKGFFKMARNKNNMCGIATEAVYPMMNDFEYIYPEQEDPVPDPSEDDPLQPFSSIVIAAIFFVTTITMSLLCVELCKWFT